MSSNGRPPADRRKASLVAVLTEPMDVDAAPLTGLDLVADSLEVRGDEAGDLHPDRLRPHFRGRLVYSLAGTPDRHGNRTTRADRSRRLVAAADAGYDVVDLRWPFDATPEVLDRIVPGRRRISWHGPSAPLPWLRNLVEEMRSIPAPLYLVSLESGRAGSGGAGSGGAESGGPNAGEGALRAMQLLGALGRDDVTAFATGAAGLWSRVLAPWLGAPVAFGRVAAPSDDDDMVTEAEADGMPTLAHLVEHYGLPDLPRLEDLYGIVGRPARRSFSPLLHNAAYRSLGLPALFLPFGAESLPSFWADVVERGLDGLGLRLRGATITSPHKEDALLVARDVTDAARQAGAANLLTRAPGGWRADTTDSTGVMAALAQAGVDPAGQPAAVIGCGGAGRAAASALVQAQAHVTLVNRGQERGRWAAELLDLPFVPLQELDPSPYSLVLHATPLQREAPFDVARLAPGTTVLDMVYGRRPTRLITEARERDLVTIDGWDVLVAEVDDQFRLMTGHSLPAAVFEQFRATRSGNNGRRGRSYVSHEQSLGDLSGGV